MRYLTLYSIENGKFNNRNCCSGAKLCPIFATPWTEARQASLSFTISQNLLKLMCIDSVMPSSHLILFVPFSCLQSFPASESFPVSWLFASGDQSIGASGSASVLPVNIQGWFPLRLTDLISLLSKGLSRAFFNTTVQKHQFFNAQPSLWSNSHICTWLLEKNIALTMSPSNQSQHNPNTQKYQPKVSVF